MKHAKAGEFDVCDPINEDPSSVVSLMVVFKGASWSMISRLCNMNMVPILLMKKKSSKHFCLIF